MKEIKRYDFQKCSYGYDLFEKTEGNWVKYSDCTQLLETVESLKNCLNCEYNDIKDLDRNCIRCRKYSNHKIKVGE